MPRPKRAAMTDSAKPVYGFKDVIAFTAATRSNLIHWSNIGILTPDLEDTSGPGYPRRFSPVNLIEAEIGAVVNGFRVPAETIKAALNTFRSFHRDMLRFDAEMHESIGKVRSKSVMSFLHHRLGVRPTETELLEGAEYVRKLSYRWRRIRRGPLSRGEVDPEIGPQFLGLFISGISAKKGFTYAVIELDPPNLWSVIEGSAIVIDLASIVFRVGERFTHLGVQIGEW